MAQASPSDESDEDHNEDYEDDDLTYPMQSSPKGICVIINNRDFNDSGQNSEKLETRHGTDVDRDALRLTFQGLDFKVECRENLTCTEMIHTMYDMARQDHRHFDCFVCCVLSHGSLNKVYGCDGVAVEIPELTMPLKPSSCPSLADKPKVFILQACQGQGRQKGHAALERDTLPTDMELIPNESDFLLAYSTVPGFESYRDTEKGSIYIQTLARTLSKHSGLDILEVLTKVNYAVGRKNNKLKGEGHGFKQSPAPLYSLRKKLIFGQGVQSQNPLNNLLTQHGMGPSSSLTSDQKENSARPRQPPPQEREQEKIVAELLRKAQDIEPQLEWFLHAYKCQTSGNAACKLPRCREMKHVLQHLKTCAREKSCQALHCASLRPFFTHMNNCIQGNCPVCHKFKQ